MQDPKPELRALIFDMDGVLADTLPMHANAWQRIAQQLGLQLTNEILNSYRGRTREDCLTDLLTRAGGDLGDINHWAIRKDEYMQSDLDNFTQDDLLPGAYQLVKQAHQAGLRTGVASSSRNARVILSRSGLDQWLDIIADGVTVQRPKPAPDIFLWVIEQMGVPAAATIVFEDSTAGTKAAREAGMFVIGLGSADYLPAAHVVLPDLRNLSLQNISDLFRQWKP